MEKIILKGIGKIAPMSKPEVFHALNMINNGKYEVKVLVTNSYESIGFSKAGLVGIVYVFTKGFYTKKGYKFEYEPCYITEELIVSGCSNAFASAKVELLKKCTKWVLNALN